jgi:hypothetical protein
MAISKEAVNMFLSPMRFFRRSADQIGFAPAEIGFARLFKPMKTNV